MRKTISAGAVPTVSGRIVRPRLRSRVTLCASAMRVLLCTVNLHAQPAPVLQRGADLH